MSSQPKTQRAVILEGVRKALVSLNNTIGGVMRKVERKAWTPGETMLPSIVVNDDGATRSNDKNQSETSKVILLKFQVIINMAMDAGRESDVMDWTDIVEKIRIGIQNFNPKCGVKRMDVVDDTPIKVELGVVTVHLWVIDCECEYFVEVQAFA